MCLIVYKPDPTAYFTNRQFKTMIGNMRDGLGMMWRQDGRIMYDKSIGSKEEKFEIFKANRNRPMWAMHARMKTHGLIDEANCHPYEIFNIDKGDPFDLYVMHNGVLSDAPNLEPDKSDTWHYMEYMLKPLLKADPDLLWTNPYIQAMVTKAIGANRLLFMRSDEVEEPVLIFNYKVGDEKNGCWLSNGHGCREVTSHTTTYHYPARSNYDPKNTHWDAQLKRYVPNAKDDSEEKKDPTVTYGAINNTGRSGNSTESEPDEYGRSVEEYDQQTFTQQGNLLLPNHSNDDKIVHLKASSLKPKADESLLWMLDQLRTQSDDSIKHFIRDDPDMTADIIMGLYSRNTMTYDVITKLVKTPKGLDDMVNLIRHMIVDRESSVKTASRL